MQHPDRKRAFFEVEAAGEKMGRVEFELAADVLPLTCRNFLELCAGTARTPDGRPLSYKVTAGDMLTSTAACDAYIVCVCVFVYVCLQINTHTYSVYTV